MYQVVSGSIGKGKAIPVQALRFPEFIDNRHNEVAHFQPYAPAELTPQYITPVLIHFRGCIDPSARVGPEGLSQ
jgi:hypothetical protein